MPRLGRNRTALFSLLLALGLYAVLEAGSFVVLWARDGRLPSPAHWREERARVAAELGAAEAGPEPVAPGADGLGQVIHPFLGFVYDPAVPNPYWEIDAQGFPQVPEPEAPAGTPRFVVAVFGGSVANGFCFAGRNVFRRILRESQRVPGQAIHIRCFAMGGYKQPQQLMALSYALSLGTPIDLVINLDGFNDVVLPVAENLHAGIYPFYPRWWSSRVAGIQSGESLRLLGLAELHAERRRARAGLCASPPLAWSPTCHLVWSALDRASAARVFDAQRRLAAQVPRRVSFLTRGPKLEPPEGNELYRRLAAHWAESSSLMADLCRARGIAYFHFLQPNQYLAGSKPMGREERRIAIDPRQPYRPPVEEGYPVLIETGRALAARGVAFHDLTGIFAGHSEPLYGDSCCHYNREGNRLLAEAIGRIVVAGLDGTVPPGVAADRSAP